jgi:RNA polymerase sigma-70 factor (ECF subfamily)
MTENQIIQAASKNDKNAQTRLYHLHKTNWYMICLRYNSCEADAMDVLQNALIKIFTNLKQFESRKGKFKSWSGKIIVNENLMFLRKKIASFKVSFLEEHLHVEDTYESAIDILSAEELTKLIQKLPEGYRTVFNLYVLEGYSHKEISEILKISVGTSKSQLFKAKKLLQQKLEVLI